MENISYFEPAHADVIERNARRSVEYQQWWKASRFCANPTPILRRNRVQYKPCGHCERCLLVPEQDAYSRACMRSFHYSKKTWFVTLTVSDRKMRREGRRAQDLCWTDVRNYIRRLRSPKAEHSATVAWSGCIERGEKFGRLHAHLILFGNEALTKRVIQQHWKLGRTKVGLVREKRAVARYLSKYLTKESRVKSCRHFRSGYAAAAISYPDVARAFEEAIQFSELDALGILGERDARVGFALSRSLRLAAHDLPV